MSKCLYSTITKIPTKSSKDSIIDYVHVIQKNDDSYTLNKDVDSAYFCVNIKTYCIDNRNFFI
jgi:hypothetical protein